MLALKLLFFCLNQKFPYSLNAKTNMQAKASQHLMKDDYGFGKKKHFPCDSYQLLFYVINPFGKEVPHINKINKNDPRIKQPRD